MSFLSTSVSLSSIQINLSSSSLYSLAFLFLPLPVAYGQTGSGKTFTMMGPLDNPGVNRRAIRELFTLCQEREDVDYKLEVSV